MKGRKCAQPSWISPMLATLVDNPFSDKDWIFEKKFDGVRCLVFRKGSSIILYSRNKKNMNQAYPEIKDAMAKQNCKSFIADGEIVAGEGKLESFSKLQNRMNIQYESKARQIPVKVAFYVFDLLYYNGYDLRDLSLLERKKQLKQALSFKAPIHYTTHVAKSGERYFTSLCKKGWEGVIAKRAQSKYVSKRSRDWLKFKEVVGQEFVIGGYTDPQGSRIGFGALLIGYYDKGKLRFAGKVGTGYDTKMLQNLFAKLSRLKRSTCPFDEKMKIADAHWVKPTLVCEIGFTEWTSDGKLRHPRFKGLRKDKSAKEVKRERPR